MPKRRSNGLLVLPIPEYYKITKLLLIQKIKSNIINKFSHCLLHQDCPLVGTVSPSKKKGYGRITLI